MNDNNFSGRLTYILRELNMSQTELSKKTGIYSSTISRYKTGEIEPTYKIVKIIANALGVNPAWLLGENVPIRGLGETNNPSSDLALLLSGLSYDQHVLAVRLIKSVVLNQTDMSLDGLNLQQQQLLSSFDLLDDGDKDSALKFITEFLLSSPKYQNKKETSA